MQVLDIQYLRSVNSHKNTLLMHDLKVNFDKILPIVNQTLPDQLNPDGNLQFYPNKPKLPDAHLMSLARSKKPSVLTVNTGFGASCKPITAELFRTYPI